MPLFKNELAHQYLVWTKKEGAPSEKKLVISAHGGISNINGMEKPGVPKDCRLVFYGPHGMALVDPVLASIVAGNTKKLETLSSPQRSQDYELAKYQNSAKTKHNKGNSEDYKAIETMADLFPVFSSMALKGGDTIYAENYKKMEMDILTIRSRRLFSKYPLLSAVLKELWRANYKYEEIHCAFCRGGDGDYNAPNLPGR